MPPKRKQPSSSPKRGATVNDQPQAVAGATRHRSPRHGPTRASSAPNDDQVNAKRRRTGPRALRMDTEHVVHNDETMASPSEYSAGESTRDSTRIPSTQENAQPNLQQPQQETMSAPVNTQFSDPYVPPHRPLPRDPRRRDSTPPGIHTKAVLGPQLLSAAFKVKLVNFEYEPIQADQVRLMTLEHGQDTDPIKVSLFTVPYGGIGGNQYRFEALSYNWGDRAASSPLHIRDASRVPTADFTFREAANHLRYREMRVKHNLYEALYHLRSNEKDIWLWVDALCINQSSPSEKGIQVARIHDIYTAADNVIIWLGPGNRYTAPAIDLLLDLTDVDLQSQIVVEDNERPLTEWKALTNLMKATWFSRRWVIQELTLAKNAVVYCGNSGIHWNDLRDGISFFVKNEDLIRERFRKSEDFDHDWDALEDLEALAASTLVEKVGDVFHKNARSGTSVAQQGLETLTSSLCAFQTSDPRDTLNGLINISKEGIDLRARVKTQTEVRSRSQRQATAVLVDVEKGRSDPITRVNHFGRDPPPAPDYKKDLLEVYVGFLKWVTDSTRCIDILCRHWAIPERLREVFGYPELVTLPTWIKLTTEGAFRYSENTWRRQNADSLVGLPGESPYKASADRSNQAEITFEIQPACVISLPNETQGRKRKTASVTVKGLCLGTIVTCTDPMPVATVTKEALRMLGWNPSASDQHVAELKDDIWRPLVVERGSDGRNPPFLWRRSCMQVLANHTPDSINIEKILPKIKLQHTRDFLKRVRQVTCNRKFLQVLLKSPYSSAYDSARSSVGIGPPDAEAGDFVCILYGCSVPCALRPFYDENDSIHAYKFLGEMYVYGFMFGEAITIPTTVQLDELEKEFKLV